MSNALLAHVTVSDSARFDVEQKVLGGVPLTADDGEMLLALIYCADERIEEAEGERDDAHDEADATNKEVDRLTQALEELREKITALTERAA